MDRSYCKYCGAPIGWITTVAGRRMPVDLDLLVEWITSERPPGDAQRIALMTESGVYEHGFESDEDDPTAEEIEGYVSHFATCLARKPVPQEPAPAPKPVLVPPMSAPKPAPLVPPMPAPKPPPPPPAPAPQAPQLLPVGARIAAWWYREIARRPETLRDGEARLAALIEEALAQARREMFQACNRAIETVEMRARSQRETS